MEKKKERYHHGDLAHALVREATQMVEAGPHSQFSLRDLAGRVGVSAPAVYRHFADKEALQAAVAAVGFQELLAELEAASASGPPLARLCALGDTYAAFAARRPAMFRLMMETARPEDGATPLRALIERTVTACGAEQPDMPVTVVWSLMHGAATLGFGEGVGAILARIIPRVLFS